MKTVTMIHINDLTEHPENGVLLPPLCAEARNKLRDILVRDMEPRPFAVIRDNGRILILDGNNRYKLLREIGFDGEIPCIDKGEMTIEEQRTYIEDTALAHRDLDDKWREHIARRQVARGKPQKEVAETVGRDQSWVSRKTKNVKKARKAAQEEAVTTARSQGVTQKEVAEKLGVSKREVQRAERRQNMQMHKMSPSHLSTNETVNVGSSTDSAKRVSSFGNRKIIEHDNGQAEVLDIDEIMSEEAILRRASQMEEESPVRKAISRSKFNVTNDNIEWAKYTWNPVVGCKHGCSYCYARDISDRFNDFPFDEPKFFEERLSAPENTNAKFDDMTVFVCSMADLFGSWVNQKWIDRILQVVKKNPEWTFIFLTKNPKRLVKIDWPDNAWVGTTVDSQERVEVAEAAMKKVHATVKFFSCEPLLEEIIFKDLSCIDWIIIGGASKSSKTAAMQPKWEWVENILNQARVYGIDVYFKPNLTVRPKEYPND